MKSAIPIEKGENFLIRDNFATATFKPFDKLYTCKIVRILQRIMVIIIIIVSVKIMTLRRSVSSPKLLCLEYNILTLTKLNMELHSEALIFFV